MAVNLTKAYIADIKQEGGEGKPQIGYYECACLTSDVGVHIHSVKVLYCQCYTCNYKKERHVEGRNPYHDIGVGVYNMTQNHKDNADSLGDIEIFNSVNSLFFHISQEFPLYKRRVLNIQSTAFQRSGAVWRHALP